MDCENKELASKDEVRTINGQLLPTYRAACEALGLLGDDKEWNVTLEESTVSATSAKLRMLFAQILVYCDVADPMKLWTKHWCAMQDDIPLKVSDATGIPDYQKEVFTLITTAFEEGRQGLLFVYGHGDNDQQDDEDTSQITVLQKYCIDAGKEGLSKLINFIYDDATLKAPTASTLQEKAIVCPKNDTTDEVNAKILSSTKGVMKTYLCRDEAIPLGKQTSETEMLYLMEYLNTLTFPGFPPHELQLKVGTPIMMLQNVNLSGGLCNDTRMIVISLMSRLIEA
nr:DNA helicase [Tanacetum cinerariifolium]